MQTRRYTVDVILRVYREGTTQFKTAYLSNFPLATTLTDLKVFLRQATSLLDGGEDFEFDFQRKGKSLDRE